MIKSIKIFAAAVLFSFIAMGTVQAQDEYLHDQEYAEDTQMYQNADNRMYGTVDEQRFYQEVDNRRQMEEMVNNIGLNDYDQAEIVDYVIQDSAMANSEGLRNSDISNEAWGQIRDDARFE